MNDDDMNVSKGLWKYDVAVFWAVFLGSFTITLAELLLWR